MLKNIPTVEVKIFNPSFMFGVNSTPIPLAFHSNRSSFESRIDSPSYETFSVSAIKLAL